MREGPTSLSDARAGGETAGAQVGVHRCKSSALTGSSARCIFYTETASSLLLISPDIFFRSPLGWILIYFVTLSLISEIQLQLLASLDWSAKITKEARSPASSEILSLLIT